MSKAYVVTRQLGDIVATVCAAPGEDYELPAVATLSPEPFEVRYDGTLSAGAVQLALSILADFFEEAGRGNDIATLRVRGGRAELFAQPFAFDHFTAASPMPMTLGGDYINRWLRAHTPVAA